MDASESGNAGEVGDEIEGEVSSTCEEAAVVRVAVVAGAAPGGRGDVDGAVAGSSRQAAAASASTAAAAAAAEALLDDEDDDEDDEDVDDEGDDAALQDDDEDQVVSLGENLDALPGFTVSDLGGDEEIISLEDNVLISTTIDDGGYAVLNWGGEEIVEMSSSEEFHTAEQEVGGEVSQGGGDSSEVAVVVGDDPPDGEGGNEDDDEEEEEEEEEEDEENGDDEDDEMEEVLDQDEEEEEVMARVLSNPHGIPVDIRGSQAQCGRSAGGADSTSGALRAGVAVTTGDAEGGNDDEVTTTEEGECPMSSPLSSTSPTSVTTSTALQMPSTSTITMAVSTNISSPSGVAAVSASVTSPSASSPMGATSPVAGRGPFSPQNSGISSSGSGNGQSSRGHRQAAVSPQRTADGVSSSRDKRQLTSPPESSIDTTSASAPSAPNAAGQSSGVSSASDVSRNTNNAIRAASVSNSLPNESAAQTGTSSASSSSTDDSSMSSEALAMMQEQTLAEPSTRTQGSEVPTSGPSTRVGHEALSSSVVSCSTSKLLSSQGPMMQPTQESSKSRVTTSDSSAPLNKPRPATSSEAAIKEASSVSQPPRQSPSATSLSKQAVATSSSSASSESLANSGANNPLTAVAAPAAASSGDDEKNKDEAASSSATNVGRKEAEAQQSGTQPEAKASRVSSGPVAKPQTPMRSGTTPQPQMSGSTNQPQKVITQGQHSKDSNPQAQAARKEKEFPKSPAPQPRKSLSLDQAHSPSTSQQSTSQGQAMKQMRDTNLSKPPSQTSSKPTQLLSTGNSQSSKTSGGVCLPVKEGSSQAGQKLDTPNQPLKQSFQPQISKPTGQSILPNAPKITSAPTSSKQGTSQIPANQSQPQQSSKAEKSVIGFPNELMKPPAPPKPIVKSQTLPSGDGPTGGNAPTTSATAVSSLGARQPSTSPAAPSSSSAAQKGTSQTSRGPSPSSTRPGGVSPPLQRASDRASPSSLRPTSQGSSITSSSTPVNPNTKPGTDSNNQVNTEQKIRREPHGSGVIGSSSLNTAKTGDLSLKDKTPSTSQAKAPLTQVKKEAADIPVDTSHAGAQKTISSDTSVKRTTQHAESHKIEEALQSKPGGSISTIPVVSPSSDAHGLISQDSSTIKLPDTSSSATQQLVRSTPAKKPSVSKPDDTLVPGEKISPVGTPSATSSSVTVSSKSKESASTVEKQIGASTAKPSSVTESSKSSVHTSEPPKQSVPASVTPEQSSSTAVPVEPAVAEPKSTPGTKPIIICAPAENVSVANPVDPRTPAAKQALSGNATPKPALSGTTKPVVSGTPTSKPSVPGISTAKPAVSGGPAAKPSDASTPAAKPTIASTLAAKRTVASIPAAKPTVKPALSDTPSVKPALTGTPSAKPTVAGSPAAKPATAGAPAVKPVLSGSPAAKPAVAGTPPAKPAVAGTPPAKPAVAGTPAAKPAVAGTPAAKPAVAGTPATKPAVAGTPATKPADAGSPAAKSTVAGTPAAKPSIAGTPAAKPALTGTPPAKPAVSGTPAATPTVAGTPTAKPAVSGTPAAKPAVSGTPAAKPAVSGTPAAKPAVSGTPAAKPAVSGTPAAKTAVSGTPAAKPAIAGTPAAKPALPGNPATKPTIAGAPVVKPVPATLTSKPTISGTPAAKPAVSGAPGAKPSVAVTPAPKSAVAGTSTLKQAAAGKPAVPGIAGSKESVLGSSSVKAVVSSTPTAKPSILGMSGTKEPSCAIPTAKVTECTTSAAPTGETAKPPALAGVPSVSERKSVVSGSPTASVTKTPVPRSQAPQQVEPGAQTDKSLVSAKRSTSVAVGGSAVKELIAGSAKKPAVTNLDAAKKVLLTDALNTAGQRHVDVRRNPDASDQSSAASVGHGESTSKLSASSSQSVKNAPVPSSGPSRKPAVPCSSDQKSDKPDISVDKSSSTACPPVDIISSRSEDIKQTASNKRGVASSSDVKPGDVEDTGVVHLLSGHLDKTPSKPLSRDTCVLSTTPSDEVKSPSSNSSTVPALDSLQRAMTKSITSKQDMVEQVSESSTAGKSSETEDMGKGKESSPNESSATSIKPIPQPTKRDVSVLSIPPQVASSDASSRQKSEKKLESISGGSQHASVSIKSGDLETSATSVKVALIEKGPAIVSGSASQKEILSKPLPETAPAIKKVLSKSEEECRRERESGTSDVASSNAASTPSTQRPLGGRLGIMGRPPIGQRQSAIASLQAPEKKSSSSAVAGTKPSAGPDPTRVSVSSEEAKRKITELAAKIVVPKDISSGKESSEKVKCMVSDPQRIAEEQEPSSVPDRVGKGKILEDKIPSGSKEFSKSPDISQKTEERNIDTKKPSVIPSKDVKGSAKPSQIVFQKSPATVSAAESSDKPLLVKSDKNREAGNLAETKSLRESSEALAKGLLVIADEGPKHQEVSSSSVSQAGASTSKVPSVKSPLTIKVDDHPMAGPRLSPITLKLVKDTEGKKDEYISLSPKLDSSRENEKLTLKLKRVGSPTVRELESEEKVEKLTLKLKKDSGRSEATVSSTTTAASSSTSETTPKASEDSEPKVGKLMLKLKDTDKGIVARISKGTSGDGPKSEAEEDPKVEKLTLKLKKDPLEAAQHSPCGSSKPDDSPKVEKLTLKLSRVDSPQEAPETEEPKVEKLMLKLKKDSGEMHSPKEKVSLETQLSPKPEKITLRLRKDSGSIEGGESKKSEHAAEGDCSERITLTLVKDSSNSVSVKEKDTGESDAVSSREESKLEKITLKLKKDMEKPQSVCSEKTEPKVEKLTLKLKSGGDETPGGKDDVRESSEKLSLKVKDSDLKVEEQKVERLTLKLKKEEVREVAESPDRMRVHEKASEPPPPSSLHQLLSDKGPSAGDDAASKLTLKLSKAAAWSVKASAAYPSPPGGDAHEGPPPARRDSSAATAGGGAGAEGHQGGDVCSPPPTKRPRAASFDTGPAAASSSSAAAAGPPPPRAHHHHHHRQRNEEMLARLPTTELSVSLKRHELPGLPSAPSKKSKVEDKLNECTVVVQEVNLSPHPSSKSPRLRSPPPVSLAKSPPSPTKSSPHPSSSKSSPPPQRALDGKLREILSKIGGKASALLDCDVSISFATQGASSADKGGGVGVAGGVGASAKASGGDHHHRHRDRVEASSAAVVTGPPGSSSSSSSSGSAAAAAVGQSEEVEIIMVPGGSGGGAGGITVTRGRGRPRGRPSLHAQRGGSHHAQVYRGGGGSTQSSGAAQELVVEPDIINIEPVITLAEGPVSGSPGGGAPRRKSRGRPRKSELSPRPPPPPQQPAPVIPPALAALSPAAAAAAAQLTSQLEVKVVPLSLPSMASSSTAATAGAQRGPTPQQQLPSGVPMPPMHPLRPKRPCRGRERPFVEPKKPRGGGGSRGRGARKKDSPGGTPPPPGVGGSGSLLAGLITGGGETEADVLAVAAAKAAMRARAAKAAADAAKAVAEAAVLASAEAALAAAAPPDTATGTPQSIQSVGGTSSPSAALSPGHSSVASPGGGSSSSSSPVGAAGAGSGGGGGGGTPRRPSAAALRKARATAASAARVQALMAARAAEQLQREKDAITAKGMPLGARSSDTVLDVEPTTPGSRFFPVASSSPLTVFGKASSTSIGDSDLLKDGGEDGTQSGSTTTTIASPAAPVVLLDEETRMSADIGIVNTEGIAEGDSQPPTPTSHSQLPPAASMPSQPAQSATPMEVEEIPEGEGGVRVNSTGAAPAQVPAGGEESQGSGVSSATGDSGTPSVRKNKCRMEVCDPDAKEFTVDMLAEYQWPPARSGEPFMLQEQVAEYLGVKSFKRKYPDLQRRAVEAEEKTYLREKGLVSDNLSDMGLTAINSVEVLDIMFADFPEKYEEYRRHLRERQAKEMSLKQKLIAVTSNAERSRLDYKEKATSSAASWNAKFNRARREQRRACFDLQNMTVHFPASRIKKMTREVPKLGHYPIALIPGQYTDYYKEYTPPELRYFPLNTVLYGPMKPNERQEVIPGSEGSQSDSDDTSSSDESSSSSSSEGTQDTEETGSTAGDTENMDGPVGSGPSKDSLGNGLANDSSQHSMQMNGRASVISGGNVSERPVKDEASAICKICGGDRNRNKESKAEVLIHCGTCTSSCHPSCLDLTLDMVPHIRKYDWQCTDCKTCIQCKDPADEDKMLFCDMCDRGYHIYCVGLRRVPTGRWHCRECAVCGSCGSREPGPGPDAQWQHEYKKGSSGAAVDNKSGTPNRVYAQTLCIACSKLWRRGRYCQLCWRCFDAKTDDDSGLITCSVCDKMMHLECCSAVGGVELDRTNFLCEICQEKGHQRASSLKLSMRPVVKLTYIDGY